MLQTVNIYNSCRMSLNEWCGLGESHIPWIVRGILNINVGWEIRGSSWASTVPRKAMKQFHEYLELAKKDLERAYSLNPK